jgi:hypothetical protein
MNNTFGRGPLEAARVVATGLAVVAPGVEDADAAGVAVELLLFELELQAASATASAARATTFRNQRALFDDVAFIT